MREPRPDGTPEDMLIGMVRQAVLDAQKGNGHSESARAFLSNDTWARLLNVSPETINRIRNYAIPT